MPRSSRTDFITRLVTVGALVLTGVAIGVAAPSGPASAQVADDDWLGIVNAYRSMSGLAPVTANPTWSAEARSHSCYMLQNGITHVQEPGRPGYSEGGRNAGLNGNVAVSSAVNATVRSHIELWMTGPFHAIGVLRHNLTASGFGICSDANAPRWRSGATLDVLRGINPNLPRPSQPIVFPGRNVTVPLDRFIAETPNPVTLCGWSGEAGLPLIAMMPNSVSSASATLTGPNGPVTTCALHAGNTNDATARRVLEADNAVTVVPRNRLAPGRYTATVSTNGGNVTWSFTVDPNAPLRPGSAVPSPSPQTPTAQPAPPTTTRAIGSASQFEPVTPYRHADSRSSLRVTRLTAGQVRQVDVGGGGVSAISANFTVTGQSGSGYLSVFNCGNGRPEISTINFTTGSTANQAVVPVTNGRLCVFSTANTHFIVDVNGRFRSSGTDERFTPSAPRRIYDTRWSGVSRLQPNQVRTVQVRGVSGGAPTNATAVAINLTAVSPSSSGWIRAFPCDRSTDVSNLNVSAGANRANSAIVPLAANGTICLQSNISTGAIVDLTGSFAPGSGLRFTALEPMRLLDTRRTESWANPITGGAMLTPGRVERIKVAGVRGIPNDAKAVTVNLTGVRAQWNGYATAFPCGNQPDASSVNMAPGVPATANGSMVGLSSSGELCVVSSTAAHFLIDISGVWR